MDIAYILRDLWDSKQENSMKEILKLMFFLFFSLYLNVIAMLYNIRVQ